MKKLASVFFIGVFMFIFQGNVFASEDSMKESGIKLNQIDEILKDSGAPAEVVEEMDVELKKMILENSSKDIKYLDVTKENNDLLLKNDLSLQSSGYPIPDSDLDISVVAFETSGNRVDIYPSYEWKKPVEPKGKDYFGYSTHSDYSVVPGKRSNVIYYKTSSSGSWTSAGPATYTNTRLTGYEHKGSSLGTPDYPIYIKGNFYFEVDIDDYSPVNKMAIAYVHDTSWGGSYSYGIGYGPASISISPSSSNVGYNNDAYYINY